MSRSNLTDAVSAIDRCSEDELRQIQALIAVRLGDGPSKKLGGAKGQKADGGKRGKSSKQDSKRGSKGNPQRKSQFELHPVYKAYRASRKQVELKAKKEKVSFKDVTGPEMEHYQEALANWLQTKSGFRGSKKENETSDSQSDGQKTPRTSGGKAPDEIQESPGPENESATKRRKLGEVAASERNGEDGSSALVLSKKDKPSKRRRSSGRKSTPRSSVESIGTQIRAAAVGGYSPTAQMQE
jgi:hypothetical protein